MEKNCLKCNKVFKVKPSKAESKKYCSRACFYKKVTKHCAVCGREVTRCQSQMIGEVCCGLKCSRISRSQKMTEMNLQLNPDRMIPETKAKLRAARLNTGEGKSYEKTYGRHTHRIVAEEKLGRKLLKGEVVHHKDGNKRNNHPDNLEVLESQAVHAKIHIHETLAKRKSKKDKH